MALHSRDRDKLRVFISYSRDDLYFADQLNVGLDAYGFECFIDRHGIPGGEDWKRRLKSLISEADTVVFVLTPTSARSAICAWEVNEATRLGKRILPAIWRPLRGIGPPPQLQDRNYIFFYADRKEPAGGFGTGLAKLISALNTNFDWLREHTRYLQRATDWDAGGRPTNRLLLGEDIAEAKGWVARCPAGAPEPTALHLDFIRASEEEAEARSKAQHKQLTTMSAVLSGATKIIFKLQTQMDTDTQAEVFAIFQAGAEHGDPISMRNLGALYAEGFGVVQDYAKAREWFEKGADKGHPHSMLHLGKLYQYGQGVAQDYTTAREWYERAACAGDRNAMNKLGALYAEGFGVAQDYDKAREWFEKAVDAVETKHDNGSGHQTAQALIPIAWCALCARDFTKALAAADRAHALLPADLAIETNRAHALMFLGHGDDAKKLYLANKGKPIPEQNGKLWENAIVKDFAILRKAGLTHVMMAEIEEALGAPQQPSTSVPETLT